MPTHARRASAAQMAQRNRKRQRPPQHPSPREEGLFDLRITMGLYDRTIRISQADWDKIYTEWMVGAQSIVLRGAHPSMESDIVIRGGESGVLQKSEASDTQIPRFQVFRVSEIQADQRKSEGR